MSDKETSEVFLNNVQSDSCIICFNSIGEEEMCVTNCGHKYCLDCLKHWFDRGNISCPFCRQDIEHFLKNNEKNNIVKITLKPNTIVSRNPQINRSINENNLTIYNRRLVYFKFCTFLNISYILYLQYKHYYLYNSYVNLYDNCTHT